MVQKDGNWQWLLEGFKFDLEAQVRPETVEYYYDHARIFVRWVETTGIAEPHLITKRHIYSFFHYIVKDSPTAKRNNGAGAEYAQNSSEMLKSYDSLQEKLTPYVLSLKSIAYDWNLRASWAGEELMRINVQKVQQDVLNAAGVTTFFELSDRLMDYTWGLDDHEFTNMANCQDDKVALPDYDIHSDGGNGTL